MWWRRLNLALGGWWAQIKAKPNSPDGTGLVHIKKQVLWPFPEFRDRSDAGVALTEFLNPKPGPNSIVFALPRGGVPVGEPLSARLKAPLELALVRKLPVPTSREMGFGAVAIDGSRILNENMLKYMRISESQIKSITDEVLIEVRRRAVEYTDHELAPSLQGMDVYLVDDGLATGYTAIAAAKMLRNQNPRSLVLAVPVSPRSSISAVQSYFDEIYCLITQASNSFAVASFYTDFHDMSDYEVREILRRAKRNLENAREKA
ncbi:MAG: phosphoribosyltransferase [Desulfomonilaceae bacterium]